VGWIPAGLFLWALVEAFRSPEGGLCRRLLLAVLCLHALFDFDTQFISVAFLMLTAASVEPKGTRKLPGPVFAALSVPLCLFALWLGTASALLAAGRPQEAAGWYPGYTEALIRMLPETENSRIEETADRILRLNGSAAPAWDRRAEAAFQRGDFDTALDAKEEAVRLSRYNRCLGRGDAAGAARCSAKLEALPGRMQAVLDGTSALGRLIDDQPHLSLPPS